MLGEVALAPVVDMHVRTTVQPNMHARTTVHPNIATSKPEDGGIAGKF
jgi:hypothetical protein